MSTPNPALLEVGQVFNDRYEVVRCLKAGGMGAVYEVFHKQTKKKRALKVMLPAVVAHEAMRKRFKIEATVVAAVESDHIAEVIDAGVDDASGAPFIVMELLRGEELGAMLDRAGKLPPEDVVLYLSQAAYGLEKTHAEGIVHRDLKPENLFVTYADDGSPRIKLLDFGIAKVLGDTSTQQTRGILGTPMFISPEQVHGEQEISPMTDVYALAHIAYNLLVGEPYWRAEESTAESLMPFLVRVMKGHTESATTRAKKRQSVDLPDAFDAWFDRAAALDPTERFGGALEMVTELAEVIGVSLDPSRRLSVTASVDQDSSSTSSSPSAPAAVTLPTVRDTSTVAAKTQHAEPAELAALQARAVTASSTAAISHTLSNEKKSTHMGVVLAVVLVLGGGIFFVGTQLIGDGKLIGDGSETAAPARADETAPTSRATPELPAAAPEPSAVALPEPTPDSAPSAANPEPTAQPATSTVVPVSVQPKGRRPSPAPPPPAPAQPSSTGWKPPVIDR